MKGSLVTSYLVMFLGACDAFAIAIAGAHGRLGRELVRQSLDRGWTVFALVRRADPIFEPGRSGWLSEPSDRRVPIRDSRLIATSYDEVPANFECDSLAICLSGEPFRPDSTTPTVRKLVATVTSRKVCLVSAFGVGDSFEGSDVGIKAMNKWYLKSTYEAKREQERIVSDLPSDVDVMILRPRVLSFDTIPWNPISTSRRDLARSIVDWSSAKL